jgi:hypothetical protein
VLPAKLQHAVAAAGAAGLLAQPAARRRRRSLRFDCKPAVQGLLAHDRRQRKLQGSQMSFFFFFFFFQKQPELCCG